MEHVPFFLFVYLKYSLNKGHFRVKSAFGSGIAVAYLWQKRRFGSGLIWLRIFF